MAFTRSFPFSSTGDRSGGYHRSLAIWDVLYRLPSQGLPQGGPVTNPWKAPSDARSVVAVRNRPGTGPRDARPAAGLVDLRRRLPPGLPPVGRDPSLDMKGQAIWRFLDGIHQKHRLK
jgi:hypothetical protein